MEQITATLGQGILRVEICFRCHGIKRLQDCGNVIKANHAIQQFTERFPEPFRGLYLNKFYINRYSYLLK